VWEEREGLLWWCVLALWVPAGEYGTLHCRGNLKLATPEAAPPAAAAAVARDVSSNRSRDDICCCRGLTVPVGGRGGNTSSRCCEVECAWRKRRGPPPTARGRRRRRRTRSPATHGAHDKSSLVSRRKRGACWKQGRGGVQVGLWSSSATEVSWQEGLPCLSLTRKG